MCRKYVAVKFQHSCLPVSAWRRVVLHFFRPETIVASFLHLMVLFFKVLLNQGSPSLTRHQLKCLIGIIKNVILFSDHISRLTSMVLEATYLHFLLCFHWNCGLGYCQFVIGSLFTAYVSNVMTPPLSKIN